MAQFLGCTEFRCLTSPRDTGLRMALRLHNDPAFIWALGIPAAANSILYHLQYPHLRKEKMSQYLSHNTHSFNTSYTVRVSNNFTVADDRSNILAWLSSLDPKSRHQDIQDRRVENIGEWLLQTEEFRSWYAGSEGGESNNAVLFCYGDPGVGKTYIR